MFVAVDANTFYEFLEGIIVGGSERGTSGESTGKAPEDVSGSL